MYVFLSCCCCFVVGGGGGDGGMCVFVCLGVCVCWVGISVEFVCRQVFISAALAG